MADQPKDPKSTQKSSNEKLDKMLQAGKKQAKYQERQNEKQAALAANQAKIDILKANGDKKAAKDLQVSLQKIENIIYIITSYLYRFRNQ